MNGNRATNIMSFSGLVLFASLGLSVCNVDASRLLAFLTATESPVDDFSGKMVGTAFELESCAKCNEHTYALWWIIFCPLWLSMASTHLAQSCSSFGNLFNAKNRFKYDVHVKLIRPIWRCTHSWNIWLLFDWRARHPRTQQRISRTIGKYIGDADTINLPSVRNSLRWKCIEHTCIFDFGTKCGTFRLISWHHTLYCGSTTTGILEKFE